MVQNFLGMDVEGDIIYSQKSVPQRTKKEFEELLESMLSLREVAGLAWTQYTPYFNDGDPCIFGTGELSIALDGVDERPEYFDYGWQEDDADERGIFWLTSWNDLFEKYIGNTRHTWETNEYGGRQWKYETDPSEAPNPAVFKAFTALANALDSQEFNNVLMDLFGDHAIVRIDNRNGKIVVDEYSHE